MKGQKIVEATMQLYFSSACRQSKINSSLLLHGNSYASSLITEILQGFDKFYHMHCLPLFERCAAAFVPAVDSMLRFHVIEVYDFIFEYLVDHQVEDIVEIYHITAEETGRQLTQQLVVLAALSTLLDQLVQSFLLLQLSQLQVQQVHFSHTILIAQFKNTLRSVFRQIEVSLRWLINVHLFDVLLIQLFLYLFCRSLLSCLFSQSSFLLTEYAFELRRRKKAVFESYFLLLLLVQVIVLIQVVIDAHVTTKVDGWQVTLQCGLLGQSIQVECAFSGVEEGMVR